MLFNVADIAVVGRFAGASALGSVGSTTILVTMFTSFLIGVSGGINVLTALYLGSGDRKGVRETVHSAFLFSILTGLTLLLIGAIFSKGILELLNTKPELIDGAVLYIRIYFLGMPALAVYNFGNAVFSAAGDTKRPLKYLSMAGVVNIILNLFFVIVCKMDVAGVAVSSIISQYLSAAMISVALFRSGDIYGLHRSELRLNRNKTVNIIRIGIPAGLQNAIFQIANLFVQAGVNDVMTAFYTACGSFMGQNFGAGNRKRVRNSYLISLAYSFGIGMIMGLGLVLFGHQFLSLFSTDADVIEAGMIRLSIMGVCYGFSAFMDCTIMASRALGKSMIPMVIVIIGSCVFRVVWIYTVFAYFHTILSLYSLYIFSWGITAIAEIIYFVYTYKKRVC